MHGIRDTKKIPCYCYILKLVVTKALFDVFCLFIIFRLNILSYLGGGGHEKPQLVYGLMPFRVFSTIV